MSASLHDRVGAAIRERVERILCLTCPQGFEYRYPRLRAEFEKYGLGDVLVPVLNAYSAIEHAELDRRSFANDGARAVNVRNCALGHYHIARFALDAGYRSVLVVEDDCRFGPPDVILRYLADLPPGVSAVLSYAGLRGAGTLFPRRGWVRWGIVLPGVIFDLTTCYMLDTYGMRALVRYFESAGSDGSPAPFDAADRAWPYLAANVPLYIPRISLFHQSGDPSVIHGHETVTQEGAHNDER